MLEAEPQKNKMLEADPDLEKISILATNNLDNAEE